MSTSALLARARTRLSGGVAAGVLLGSLAFPMTLSTGTAAAALPSHPFSGPGRGAHPWLDPGESGRAVKWVQTRLNVSPRSGYYGAVTRAAVKDFQSSRGLPRTGHVHRATWRALNASFGQYKQPGHHRRGDFGRRVMRTARSLKGIPYRYGGTTTSGFDCSGFTGYVFARNGVSLPRVASSQYAASRHISRSQAKRGDLVAFPGSGGIYHIGIYAGHNRIWHSPRTGSTVHRQRLWTSNVLFGRVRR